MQRWGGVPRQRSPDREKAKKIWLDSGGEKKLTDIASELGVSQEQVRKWKCEDEWEGKKKSNVTKRKKGNVTKRKKGGQPGHAPYAPPPPPPPEDNKRALKTGEFERILFSSLTQEEREMVENACDDPTLLIQQEILLGAVREKRMLGRIGILSDLERTNRNGMIAVSTRVSGSMGASPFGGAPVINPKQVVNETRDALESIINVEEALTRVQNSRQSAIVALHRMGIDIKKLEYLKRKDGFGDDDDENEDDGFIAAIKASGKEVFLNGMDEPQDSDP
jgi:uncharacterized protein YjcR